MGHTIDERAEGEHMIEGGHMGEGGHVGEGGYKSGSAEGTEGQSRSKEGSRKSKKKGLGRSSFLSGASLDKAKAYLNKLKMRKTASQSKEHIEFVAEELVESQIEPGGQEDKLKSEKAPSSKVFAKTARNVSERPSVKNSAVQTRTGSVEQTADSAKTAKKQQPLSKSNKSHVKTAKMPKSKGPVQKSKSVAQNKNSVEEPQL
ncbi:unnamed protein product [Bursaphelenchus okinawaensis]|uniref:Uncharacterized protein n=1 Tax=Bursaphelenchus okinawaensis TaxID=465554 RepID=A0A811KB03_9BILA|nr:unnamed protein product [Bursaphelenchus okinawaensis]CAG9097108.1 unnamed protein product [Bursaphelenchus okinawaensis]